MANEMHDFLSQCLQNYSKKMGATFFFMKKEKYVGGIEYFCQLKSVTDSPTYHANIRHMTEIKIINRSHHPLPAYATPLSAGMDIRANLEAPVVLPPMGRALIPTGLFMAIPAGYEAQVRPRSGLALKKGITLLNSPGTIDADYRGELGVILVNLSNEPFTVNDGERIAQLVVARHEVVTWQPVETLDETERGEGGFGHTGR